MRAYLIDPVAKAVTEIDYNGNWTTIAPILDCDLFTMVGINEHEDGIYVDDEGLINGNAHGWFAHRIYPNPLRGRGLVLGTDHQGDSVSPHVTLEELANDITFPTDEDVRRMVGL